MAGENDVPLAAFYNPLARPYTLNGQRVDPSAPGPSAPPVMTVSPVDAPPARPGALTVTPTGAGAVNDPFGLLGGGAPGPGEKPYSVNPAMARPGTPYAQNANLTSQDNMSVNPVGNRYRPGAGGAGGAGGSDMSAWGGGGGTVRVKEHSDPTTDPEYIKQMERAYGQQRGAYEGEKSAETLLATADQRKHLEEAGGLLGEKAAVGKGKEDMERQTKERKAKSDEWLARLDKESEKLANEKFEKPSFMQETRWTIARMLGAVQQGMLHLGTNQVADMIDRQIQQDTERQKAEWERHKGRKEDLKSLYSQAYAATGDEMEATKLANGLGLEMAKKETGALVASADSDVARARGDVLNAAIDVKKAQLAGQEAESEMKTHKWTPATTVSTGPSDAAVQKRAIEIANKGAEHGVDVSPVEARRRAYFELTGRDPMARSGAGVPMVDYAKKEKMTKEEREASERGVGSKEVNKQFADLKAHPVLDEIGWGARSFTQALPQGLGGLDAAKTSSRVDALNLQVLGAAGRVLKDSEGRIAPPVLEALKKFEVHDGDSKELALQKLDGAQNFINATARQGGVMSAPAPNQAAAPLPSSAQEVK